MVTTKKRSIATVILTDTSMVTATAMEEVVILTGMIMVTEVAAIRMEGIVMVMVTRMGEAAILMILKTHMLMEDPPVKA